MKALITHILNIVSTAQMLMKECVHTIERTSCLSHTSLYYHPDILINNRQTRNRVMCGTNTMDLERKSQFENEFSEFKESIILSFNLFLVS